jgi:hypothetical protein
VVATFNVSHGDCATSTAEGKKPATSTALRMRNQLAGRELRESFGFMLLNLPRRIVGGNR